GIAAAITAAREGAKVVLVEPTNHVGGLSTSGINTAESEHMLPWTIGGFADEFYRRVGRYYEETKDQQLPLDPKSRLNTFYFFESSVAEKVYLALLREAGVEIRYGAAVERVAKDGARLTAITLTDGASIGAKVFIDASYEGDLMARAGVSYTFGREARSRYDEDAAGVRFDQSPRKATTVDEHGKLLPGISAWAKDLNEGDAHPGVMNYNFRLTCTKREGNKVQIPPPAFYDRTRYRLLENWLRGKAERGEKVKMDDFLGIYKRRNEKFEVNNQQAAIISLGDFGAQFGWPDGSYEERARIYVEHKEYTLGLLQFLRTEEVVPEYIREEIASWGFAKDEFPDNGNFPYQLYVREGRRMKGATIVTQHDVTNTRRKPDSIGLSSHFIDCHHVQRVALSPTEFVNEGRIWRIGWAYQIPYRALTPLAAEATNLLVPGAASYSHVAYCTLRLESVWMIAGHAAGVAAATAVREGKTVQQIDVDALQEKLRAQKQVVDFIPGQPERFEGGSGGNPEF
ncbi:MAG TPA: FAD-dependent oxidoreductase, partial [Pirellulales bacterium]|nr:FAD-dependent oxidoreductase [Pirellulales bacterium]